MDPWARTPGWSLSTLVRALLVTIAAPGVLGVLAAFLLLPPATVIGVLAGGAVGGAAWQVLLSDGPGEPGRLNVLARCLRSTSLRRSAGYGAVGLLAVAGLVGLLGQADALLLCVGALAIVGADRVLSASATSREPPAPDPWWEADELRAWSDDEVCRAWRTSYVRLARCRGRALEAVAGERRAYLDELERRNPAGFRVWMSSGARAASNPARYIITRPTPR